MKIEKDILKRIFIYINLIILVASIVFFVLDLDVISVIHAKESEWLPVEKFETYSSNNLSITYIIIILALMNLIFMLLHRIKPIRIYIISFIPIIALIFIVLLFLNPHSLIINPTGFPPTRLDKFEIGVIYVIILSVSLIISSICIIYMEGFIIKYLITLTTIIGALLLSDFIHESGHVIFVLISGGEITEFYPFPVLLGGEFNAGYVGFTNVPINLIPLVLLGGEIFQWITISLILIVLYFKPKYRKNVFILTLLLIAFLDFPLYVINNSIGLPHWFLVGSTNGDLMIFSGLTGFPLWLLIIFACIQLLITGFIFYILIFKNRGKLVKEEYKHS